ncbi:PEP/pyruvate-binding domain-containing protein [Nonomuraea sp. 10N515B]|uniref:PEP/pyruvate-binding domain-containing protein n=1 Tax=Nonomuraea sp. 10N515B TaxID=3457422 RepID=UPI003FCEA9A4
MNVIKLADIDAGMIDLVGGKAAGLCKMIDLGERVPDGFCVTTDAFKTGDIPEEEVWRAYAELGGGAVAVRSSATAEDLPEASFAGQQDTFLGVTGREGLLKAIRQCWDSLNTERAVAYREAAGIGDSAMAVVVQRMVEPKAAGVLFTANPITGTRTEMVVDAAPGLGTAVVDGSTIPDHYVLNGTPPPLGGCLSPAQLDELRGVGERLQGQLGWPQDIEFAFDGDGTLWLLQTRPITTLFPLPPDTGRPAPRLYVEFGHIQGMLRPCTPMGLSLIRTGTGRWAQGYGGAEDGNSREHRRFAPIAGHLYMDITESLRDERRRKNLPQSLSLYGPRVQDAVRRMLDDPRFAPRPSPPAKGGNSAKLTMRFVLASIPGTVRSLARPDKARAQVFHMVQELRRRSAAPAELTTSAQRLHWVVQDSWAPLLGPDFIAVMVSISLALRLSAVPPMLLKGIATDEELDHALGGMPHNVTTEMNLALWQVSRNALQHQDLFLATPPAELAERFRNGTLPDIGLRDFLDSYGFRAAAEIDVGMPRWSEDPTPLVSTIVNYLRVTDPDQAPDLRFERAAAKAESTIEELARRARRTRPIRGRLAGSLMRRFRKLIGLREIGKFCMVPMIAAVREQLLLIGADLAGRGLLERADDIMFLDLEEVGTAVNDGADHREIAAARRAEYDREVRRTRIPAAVLSDGTDIEALAPPAPAQNAGDGRTLTGTAGAAGRATGRARVIRDPAQARIDPGEILVAPTTDPGWTPLFMTAAGLVSETGSPLAHGPTVAREYGIPAVVCVRDATTRIQTGQLITIDGASGTVTIEQEP